MEFLARFKKICADIDNPSASRASKTVDKANTAKAVRLFDIRKISLPPGIDKVVLIGLTEKEADWWIENKLKARIYEDDTRDTKTLIFYEKFPQNATPRERSIYSNPKRFCTEEFPESKAPKRIN